MTNRSPRMDPTTRSMLQSIYDTLHRQHQDLTGMSRGYPLDGAQRADLHEAGAFVLQAQAKLLGVLYPLHANNSR